MGRRLVNRESWRTERWSFYVVPFNKEEIDVNFL